MSEYIIKLPNDGAAYECIMLRGYEKNLYGYELHEEIVRCRDCKYHHEGMCTLTDGRGDFKRWFVDDDDYCSDGEKAVGV